MSKKNMLKKVVLLEEKRGGLSWATDKIRLWVFTNEVRGAAVLTDALCGFPQTLYSDREIKPQRTDYVSTSVHFSNVSGTCTVLKWPEREAD